MTKVKKIKSIKALLVCMGFALFGAVLFNQTGGTETAEAILTPKYSVAFTAVTWANSNGAQSESEESVPMRSATFQIGQYVTSTYSLEMWGDSYSGSAEFPVNGYINSKNVNLKLNSSSGTPVLFVYNSSGAQLSAEMLNASLTNLADGSYYGTFAASGGWLVNQRWYNSVGFNAKFLFNVDTVAPTISGASTSTTGTYKNGSFTVTASDSRSGIKNLYYKTPSGAYQSTTETSKTFSSGSEAGLYCFYAIDNAGNRSSTYYVMYDGTPPVGVIKSLAGSVLGNYTNTDFNYTATDENSGIDYLQYKSPTSSSWVTYASGTNISATASNGKHTFRAYDKAGNVSEEKFVYLDTVKPSGTLYGESMAVENGRKTNASYIKFVGMDMLSGVTSLYVKNSGATAFSSYTNNSQLTDEGTYTFYCLDRAGNRSLDYVITIDRTPPKMLCSIGDFYETSTGEFVVAAIDSSALSLYYKTPSMTEYALAVETSYVVNKTSPDGRYYFYAVDELGNISSTVWVELSVAVPVIEVIKSDTDNSRYVTWEGDNYTVTVDGNSYTKGSWIRTEGEHTVVATNEFNRTTTKVFTIEHFYKAEGTTLPTCTGSGFTTYTCVHCGSGYTSDIVDARGHDFEQTVSNPTCTEKGYTANTCKVCGYSFTSDEKAQLGHAYTRTVKEPNCIEGGYTANTCSRCNHSYTSDIKSANGHDYLKRKTEPTCLSGGYTDYTCKNCEFGYTSDYVNALGHSYEESMLTATCAEQGYTLHSCIRCDDEYKTDIIPASGHKYIDEAITVTCIQNGGINHTCSICGYNYMSDIVSAIGHSYRSEVIAYATCESAGERLHCCDNCHNEYTNEIPKLSHKFELLEEINNDGVIHRVYGCIVCGYSYTEDVGEQYEEVSNFVIYLFDQYRPYIGWVFLATSGVWSSFMGVMFILAKKNDDKQKAKKALVNYLIGMVVIFCILVACPLLIKGIAVLVT